MARKSSGAVRPGTRSLATQGGTARITASSARQRHGRVGEIPAPVARAPSNAMAAQPRAQAHARAFAVQKCQRRIDEGRRQGRDGRCGGDRRGRPWPGSRAPPRRPARRSLLPARCSARPAGRAASAAPTAGPCTDSTSPMRLVAAGAQQLGAAPDNRRRWCRARGALARTTHQGSGPSLGLIVQRSPVFEIDEGELGAGRARPGDPPRRCAPDSRCTALIARQHQVIAIVDHPAEAGIEIGAAAAARLPRRFEQRRPGRRAPPARVAADRPARPAPIT